MTPSGVEGRRRPTSLRRDGTRRGATPVALTLAVLALLVAPAAAVVSAAPAVTFGPPSATATWGKGIDFVQPVVASALTRVEILVDYPGLAGPLVSQVPTSGGGQLTFTVDASKGEVLPNTTLTARWRLTRAGEPPSVGPPVSATYQDTRFQWRTKMGSIVRLHWYQGDDAFAARAVQLGDGAVKKAADLLGVTETQPIDFYVYADQNAFYDALGPGTPENIAGEAHPEIRTMFGLITPDAVATSEVARVVTHELTHLVFDTATRNPYDEPAHWINEGVAVYLSVGYGSDDRAAVAQAARDGTIMPLPSLSGRFPTTYDRLLLAYSEAVSAIDLLVRTRGQDALVKLIRSYASGVTDDEAFMSAVGMDEAAFDDTWLASVGAKKPQRFGPLPAPSGPLPPGWSAAGTSPEPASGTVPVASAAGSPGAATGDAGGSPVLVVGLLVLAGAGVVLILALRRRPVRSTAVAAAAGGGEPASEGPPLAGDPPDDAGPGPEPVVFQERGSEERP